MNSNMAYASDLNDHQWEAIKDHFQCGNYGNRSRYNKRALVNAVLYLIKTGCQWRMLPKDLPPYSTVSSFYHRAKKRGIWEKIMDALVQKSRVKSQKASNPSYAIIDSQSVKTAGAAQERGIDGGKKLKAVNVTL
ncbi:MAG: transposase [Roseivirga sp.]